MKISVGVFTTRPGKRAAYLAAAQDHLEKSRLDPDCHYIELLPMAHPDKIPLAESFVSEEAHRRHEDTEHMRALWKVGPVLLREAVIDNVIAGQLEDIRETFPDP